MSNAKYTPEKILAMREAGPDLYEALAWIGNIILSAKDGGNTWCAIRDRPGAEKFVKRMEAALKKVRRKKQ